MPRSLGKSFLREGARGRERKIRPAIKAGRIGLSCPFGQRGARGALQRSPILRIDDFGSTLARGSRQWKIQTPERQTWVTAPPDPYKTPDFIGFCLSDPQSDPQSDPHFVSFWMGVTLQASYSQLLPFVSEAVTQVLSFLRISENQRYHPPCEPPDFIGHSGAFEPLSPKRKTRLSGI